MRETKWIIGEDCRIGPFEDTVTPIPYFDDVWYFSFSMRKAYPQSQVFDNAQAAALAAIAANDEKARFIQVQTKQLQDWYDGMETKRLELEKPVPKSKRKGTKK